MGGTIDDDQYAVKRKHNHYFYDSDGHLYVDMTAVRKRGSVELISVGGGEIDLTLTEARVEKARPVLNLPITVEGDNALGNYYNKPATTEDDGSLRSELEGRYYNIYEGDHLLVSIDTADSTTAGGGGEVALYKRGEEEPAVILRDRDG